eukprot:TRINITY_DN7622_c0_g1_i5.p1 TRINITY_DN7622_c0_g1~~TRINITY_DN7622_c0_g1_i5.p1  ORF type:complete len:124 (-),score=18.48 TRINITY_DN7622_c0_g1_i5:464-835(-)
MGDNQPPQTSLMKASFTAGGTSGKGEAFVKVRATHDHVTLGENNHPLKYNTAYKDSMVPPKIENNSNSRAISQDRGTSFILGQAKGPYLSEAKSQYLRSYDLPKNCEASHLSLEQRRQNCMQD